jgi:hypothetical protein
MTRSYERDGKHYDFAVLTHLVETGEATFYEGPSIYVIKTEDGTVAVRPHQVIFTSTPAPFTLTQVEEIAAPSPMDGYYGQERYDGEDIGPHGVVFQGAQELAVKFLGDNPDGIDPLEIVRRILDDQTGEYTRFLQNEIDGTAPLARRSSSWVSADEEDEILKHFGI